MKVQRCEFLTAIGAGAGATSNAKSVIAQSMSDIKWRLSGMIIITRNTAVAMAVMFCLTTAPPAMAEEISYHGWVGGVDLINGRTAGCHLDSPAITRSSPIVIVANSSKEFYFQYNSLVLNRQLERPSTGASYDVKLAADDDYFANAHNEHWAGASFPAVVIELQPNFIRVRIRVDLDRTRDFMDHLKKAKELQVQWPFTTAGNFDLVDLQHVALTDWNTLQNVLDYNDTYGAIYKVLDCVQRHAR